MEPKKRPRIQTAVLTAAAVMAQIMVPCTGRIVASVCTDVVLALVVIWFGMKKAAVASVVIPWAAAALDLMRPVLTYPMIFANLLYVLMWHYMKERKLWAIITSAVAKASMISVMIHVVIASWLEPHLTRIYSVDYHILNRMIRNFDFHRQLSFSVLGAVIAAVLICLRKQYKDRREK